FTIQMNSTQTSAAGCQFRRVYLLRKDLTHSISLRWSSIPHTLTYVNTHTQHHTHIQTRTHTHTHTHKKGCFQTPQCADSRPAYMPSDLWAFRHPPRTFP